ncbi:MAG: hypothetical protein J6V71_03090 [Clostridia bacterium]|nr:hypothetical protein [Clostridia bacterium]
MVEPVFEKINLTKRIPQIQDQIKIECKTNVTVGEVQNVICISPFATVEKGEASAGKVKYSGKALFYICYVDASGEIKKCECGYEIKGELLDPNLLEDSKVSLSINAQKVEKDLSSSYLEVKAILEITAKIEQNQTKGALIGGDKIFADECEITSVSGLGLCYGTYPMEEEFELNFPVQEVLFHKAEGVITAVQSGMGCIIVDGQVLLSLVLLQKNDKRDIIKENKILPFRMEIECEDAMPNMQAVAFVSEKSANTQVEVDFENGTSLVRANVTLQFEGQAYVNTTQAIALDAFCTENEIDIVKEDCEQYSLLEARSYSFNVNTRAGTEEIPLGAVIASVCAENVYISQTASNEKGLEITGVYSATVYLKDSDGKLFSRQLVAPFEKRIDGEFNQCTEFEIKARAFSGKAKILSATEMELDGQVYLTVYPLEKCKVRFINDLKILGEKQENPCAISVYLGLAGEECYSLAKRLNVCPTTLIETNKDLQFPLSGTERIVVYRQK